MPNIEQAIISTHCHDDLGLAVANSLAGCEAGARQVECTINGIGERAGNAALEEVVMALKTRFDYYGLTTGIKTERLYPISRMLSTVTGLAVQRNKAIVGRNAFAHESGIHQDGMLKDRSTYEIMRPEDVGVPRTDLVLGKHSGRHALRDRVAEMGYTLTDELFETVFHDFKALADKKKEVYDEDLVVLIENHLEDVPAHWQLVGLHTTAGLSVLPTATVGDPPARRRDRSGRRHRRRPGRRDFQGRRAGHRRARQPARVRGPQRDPGQGRPRRGDPRARSRKRRPRLPRPRRLDRHHRSLGPGLLSTPSTPSPPTKNAATSARSSAGRGRGREIKSDQHPRRLFIDDPGDLLGDRLQ